MRSMVLMSTLATAADVMQAMRERRQGRDPSEQEPAHAAGAFLRQAIRELQDALISLRATLVAADVADAPYSVTATRRLNVILMLHSLSRLLHGIHQRLLSLYPEVTEDLVEETRSLESACRHLLVSNADYEIVSLFVDRSEALTRLLREAL